MHLVKDLLLGLNLNLRGTQVYHQLPPEILASPLQLMLTVLISKDKDLGSLLSFGADMDK